MTNGFSRKMWVPFADWVGHDPPRRRLDDVHRLGRKTMQRITEESIRPSGLRDPGGTWTTCSLHAGP